MGGKVLEIKGRVCENKLPVFTNLLGYIKSKMLILQIPLGTW